ncbi:hypothetical protein N7462_002455 [Penicillium macrosclerotiorum]|uniref:uncharacterized protein n=1 Tax=Penicillium macrosclerotiorum TaxID=303699 RepID=UPI0025490CEB|nr:uncharacterized protein N7462_002455 [Penicillium macrosclerotiorum]KAJ5693032.1 hypothetical protein N7462_002455 [Penicillium macrosclerotiorum]
MLHIAKQIVNGEDIDSNNPNASPLGRLSRSCSEAPRRLLNVIVALRKKNTLIIFGFFDFDACFSAAFVMILSAIIDSLSDGHPGHTQSPGLRDALETLEYLADRGNNFAQRGLHEVSQTWAHLSAYLQRRQQRTQDTEEPDVVSTSVEGSDLPNGTYPDANPTAMVSRMRAMPGIGLHSATENACASGPQSDGAVAGIRHPLFSANEGLSDALLLDTDLLDDFAHLWDGDVDPQSRSFFPGASELGSTDGDGLHHFLYPLYHNLNLDLTGGDMEDFTEFRRSVLNL